MTPFASDLSYQVLEQRRRRNELAAPALDEAVRRLHPTVRCTGVCEVTGTRLDVLTERLSGEPEPLVYEHRSELRHG